MKVELRVGAASVSCETDYRAEPSGKCSENDAAQKALFERLLGVAIEKMREWMFKPAPDVADIPDLPSGVQLGDYVRTLEKALEPVLAIDGAIEQAKRTDRNITCNNTVCPYHKFCVFINRFKGFSCKTSINRFWEKE